MVGEHDRQRLVGDVLRQHQQAAAALARRLQRRHELGRLGQLALAHEQVHLVELDLRLAGLEQEVARQQTVVEGHAAHVVDRRIDGLMVGDADDALGPEPLHSLGNEAGDLRIVVVGDAGELREHGAVADGAALPREFLERFARECVEAAPHRRGIDPGRHQAKSGLGEGAGKQRRGGRAVAHGIAGLLDAGLDQLRAECGEAVFVLQVPDRGEAVAGELGKVVRPLQHHAATLGAEREACDARSAGEARHQCLASFAPGLDVLGPLERHRTIIRASGRRSMAAARPMVPAAPRLVERERIRPR